MSAKSAPQLLQTRFRAWPTLRLRRTLVITALTLLSGAAAWLVDAKEAEALRVVSYAQRDARELTQSELDVYPESAREETRRRALSEFLARRYKVSRAVTLDLVTIAHAAGHQVGLDPLLIIAVMAVESRFNPIAESVAGAKGLMQVIPKYHTAKFEEFGGEKSVFDPEANILVGSQILKEYMARTGSLKGGLQMYVGNSSDDDDVYTGKVMTEKQRLQQVLRKALLRAEVQELQRLAMASQAR